MKTIFMEDGKENLQKCKKWEIGKSLIEKIVLIKQHDFWGGGIKRGNPFKLIRLLCFGFGRAERKIKFKNLRPNIKPGGVSVIFGSAC